VYLLVRKFYIYQNARYKNKKKSLSVFDCISTDHLFQYLQETILKLSAAVTRDSLETVSIVSVTFSSLFI